MDKLEIGFTTYNSIVPFTCDHAFKTSAYIDADEDMPVGSRHEETSTGVESESQVRRKKVIAMRRLVPIPKRPDLRDPTSLIAHWNRTLLEHAFDKDNIWPTLWKIPE